MSTPFDSVYKYKDFNIFPKSTITDIWLNDCTSSVTGKCENVKNVQECINLCKDNCNSGYFIKTPDNNNICISFYEDNIHIRPNIYKRIEKQNIYPELINTQSYVFSNQKYPPDQAMNMFYSDRVYITNIYSGKSIGVSDQKNIVVDKVLTNSPLNVQILPKVLEPNFSKIYRIRNGDEIIINVPSSTFVAESDKDNIDWKLKLSTITKPSNIMTIFTNNKNKKIGDILEYTDKIYFTIGDKTLVPNDEKDDLVLADFSDKSLFTIQPNVGVYYCDGYDCKNVNLSETDMKNGKATYKGFNVYRNKYCWGLCKKKKSNYLYLMIIFILIIFIIILTIIFKSKKS
jgi:hypothetical protein